MFRLSGLVGILLLAAVPALAQGDDPVVARVNGKELKRSDVEAMHKLLPPQVQQLPLETVYPMLVDQMVSQMLITEAAKKEKLDQDPELKKRLARYEERLMQEAWLQREVEKAAGEEQLKSRYEQYLKEHPAKEEVSARHILVDKEEDAKAIVTELDKGADFATLAKQRSKDPAAATGGDLGFFSQDEMVPEFAEAAFKLKKGEYTKTPVKTQFGWHVIKVEDRRAGAQPSFEESRDQLADEIAREVIQQKVAELRQSASVETFNLDGTKKQ
ncbi:MAG: peptidylprolyl isomerase [Rhodospirillales bacterium]|nr:peptidylprolyl isomerase [Rhodospirillales bacterium]